MYNMKDVVTFDRVQIFDSVSIFLIFLVKGLPSDIG